MLCWCDFRSRWELLFIENGNKELLMSEAEVERTCCMLHRENNLPTFKKSIPMFKKKLTPHILRLLESVTKISSNLWLF